MGLSDKVNRGDCSNIAGNELPSIAQQVPAKGYSAVETYISAALCKKDASASASTIA